MKKSEIRNSKHEYVFMGDCITTSQSGDSSVVALWTVDQEVVGSNLTHGGNLISVGRSLSGFIQPIR